MRTVSLMGSTGSIGTQALDVMRREPERFGVHRLGGAELGGRAGGPVGRVPARRRRHRRPRPLPRGARRRAGGHRGPRRRRGHGRGDERRRRGAQRGRRLRRAPRDHGGPRGRQAAGAGQQGVAHRRGAGRAEGPADARGRDRPGRLRALRPAPVPGALRGTTDVARLLLTASGGPFRGWPAERLAAVTVADALAHPTWSMGPKITIDSSTLMNKGLEVIEAHELFGIGYDRIDIVVHPQSIVHSMVELRRRVDAGPAVEPRHAPAHRVRAGLARPRGDPVRGPRLVAGPEPDLRAARPVGLPLHRPGLRGRPHAAGPRRPGSARPTRWPSRPSSATPCPGAASPTWWPRPWRAWTDDPVDQIDAVLAADAEARARARLALDRRLALGGGR